MAAIGRYIYRTLSGSMSGSSTANSQAVNTPHTPHQPSGWDVLDVKDAIQCAAKNSLPIELIDSIIDTAEYWPCVTVVTNRPFKVPGRGGARRIGGLSRSPSDVLVLRTPPIGYSPKDITDPRFNIPLEDITHPAEGSIHHHPLPDIPLRDQSTEMYAHWLARNRHRGRRLCQKIVFTITSHDQGWGGDRENQNSYRGSYTWFDVGKEKFVAVSPEDKTGSISDEIAPPGTVHYQMGQSNHEEQPVQCLLQPISPPLVKVEDGDKKDVLDHPFLPTENTLQCNLVAVGAPKQHVIIWDCDDSVDPESPLSDALDEVGRGRATGNGQFIRDLEVGDVVTVWARARFAGWVNNVDEVKMDVYWRV